MLKAINSFFDKHLKKKTADEDLVSIDKCQLACAALMIELCITDQNIDDSETETLLVILKDKFDLAEKDLEELMTLAQQETEDATSLYQFTSLINEEYEQPEKIQLIKNMWEVAYADGNLDRYEDSLIRKVSELLYVSHSDFIKTKLAIKNGE